MAVKSTAVVDLFVPEPRRLPGTPTRRRSVVGVCSPTELLAANRGDEFALVVKSTFVVGLFVPEGTPTKKALVGAASAAKNQPR